MGPDCYKIDVLYYLNPHLIWVEVVNQGRDGKICFEQLGIYGLLPMDAKMQFSQGPDVVMTMKQCGDWVPAATNAMKKLLANAEEVWFQPTYIDRRTSLFDDNTQKFGDIIIKTDTGAELSMLEELITTKFALHNEPKFHESLYSGGIKTKLNYATTLQVIRKLEQSFQSRDVPQDIWLKSLKDQTSIFQMSVDLENSIASRKVSNRDSALLQNKLRDLELCKDFDEYSAGRACSTHTKDMPNQSCSLKKKLSFIEENILFPRNTRLVPEKSKVSEKSLKHGLNKSSDESSETDELIFLNENIEFENNVKKSKPPKKTEYNMKRVAIGPPGLNPNKFIIKTFSLKDQPKEHSTDNIQPKPSTTRSNESKTSTDDGVGTSNHMKVQIDHNLNDHKKLPADKETPSSNLNVHSLQKHYNTSDNDNNGIKNMRIMSANPVYGIPKKEISKRADTQHINQNVSPMSDLSTSVKQSVGFSVQRKLELLQGKLTKPNSTAGLNLNSKTDLDSDDESISDLIGKITLKNSTTKIVVEPVDTVIDNNVVNSVNPFKNVDGSYSVFVDKLVSPILMVHSKKNNRIQTLCNLRDIPFGPDIHIVLKNMSITSPMRPQTISWHMILRGHSFFLISPPNSGKTMGYLPSVCRLVADNKNTSSTFGPSCIIVCATSTSVSEVEKISKMFLHDIKIFACHAGIDEMVLTTSLLNGCDLLICTPCLLVRILQKDFGVDLRNLTTLVLDDCDRLSDVYRHEIKFVLVKIKEMLKVRANKEWKVQHIVVSRLWCDIMSSLARKAPDSVVCISAFQECVLYSKASTSVNFVKIENKLATVINFLQDIDRSKKTVIVCRTNDEVHKLEKALTKLKYVVFACDNTMTVHDLYNLDLALGDYEEPVSGPILVCCDGNLTHLNVTDANYLVHYSLPELFSMFSKRFSVLNDNYPSIFNDEGVNVKIKILLDDSNVEQLPKILDFIRRCTEGVPVVLDSICKRVLIEKDLAKAAALVPICGNLLSSGKCPDLWNCNERHGIFKNYDKPKDWMPQNGKITFKILHFHTAISYSVRLLANVTNNETKKYPQNFSLLSLKMGLYYSKDVSRLPHGHPEVGDLCAVALKENLFERCQIMKILTHTPKGIPELVLIKLIDEEKYERTRSIHLYYLPDELKNIETHVVRVILSNIQPEDRDVTLSELAKYTLKKTIDNDKDLYIRGQVALVIGNVVFVDTLEACQDLACLNEVVVKDDLKKKLLDGHAISNPDHIPTLLKLCEEVDTDHKEVQTTEIPKPIKVMPKGRWAYFDSDDFISVFYAYADSPGRFYVRLIKFEDCIESLLRDIKKYVAESPEPLAEVNVGDIVIAKFPGDDTYERARIDNIIDDKKVECFFVDQGDLKEVYTKDLLPITEKFIVQLPFQAIECRLAGVQPVGQDWTEFSTSWFIDTCFAVNAGLKYLYAKYFTKEKAECTEGYKYSIALIDSYSEKDIIINQLIIDVNLARAANDIDCLDQVNFDRAEPQKSDEETDVVEVKQSNNIANITPVKDLLLKTPIRSVPLVESDAESSDSWDVIMSEQFMPMFNIGSIKKPPPGDNVLNSTATPKNVVKVLSSDDLVSSKLAIKHTIEQNEDSNSTASSEQAVNSNVVINELNIKHTIEHDEDLNSTASTEHAVSSNVVINEWNNETYADKPIVNFKMLPPPQSASLDSDDLSSVSSDVQTANLRKPKVCWRQNKTSVTMKILLIGVHDYQMIIRERFVKFACVLNDVKYGFEFELYGGVDCETSAHANKGQYIYVNLSKFMKRNWLTLTKMNETWKWIVYDVDGINISSDEESVQNNIKDIIKTNYDCLESDSDDDFQDDHNFTYKFT